MAERIVKPTLLTRRELLLGTASVVVGNRILHAAGIERQQLPKFSAETEVVEVFVTVRDKKGGIVKDLAKEEFALSEDGRPQTISYFSRESDLPLTVGLLVDTTPSESNMLDVERRASLAFLDRMLRPEKDAAFLIQYSYETEVLQGLTSSREELEAALDRLRTHGFGNQGGGRGAGPAGGSGGGPQGGRGQGPPGGASGFETALADAITLASEQFMMSQPGRKAILILGDGDHIGNRGKEAIAAAQRADTLIYSIRIYDKEFGANSGGSGKVIRIPGIGTIGIGLGGGPGGQGGGPGGPGGPGGGMNQASGKGNLQELSKKTGGAYFEVGKKETLDEIYAAIEEELRSQYSLGYTPGPDAQPGYRRVKVEVQRKGMVVRGREGYYPHPR
jgi:VWFA-related protein